MAGSNAIASGSAILTTNADGLKAGLEKSAKDIQAWGGRVQGNLSKSTGGKGGGGPGGMFGGLLGGGKIAGVAAGVGVAAAAVGYLGKEAKETLDDLAKMGTTAQAMGLTAEQFTGMAAVAKSVGEDTREFIESLVTMGKLGTDAAAGTKEASAAFKGLGIDANQFIKLRADEQFFQIFDALGKVQDPLKRTRFLMQAFGEDGGKYLLPLLSKAPDEIRRMANEFAVSTEAMQKATAASEAWKRVGGATDKLKQNAAIMFAPILEGAANTASRFINFLQPAFDWLGRAFGTIQTIGSAVWDAIGEKISAVWNWFKELTAGVFEWGKGVGTVQENITDAFRFLGRAAAYAWDVVKVGAGAAAQALGFVVEKAIAPVIRAFRNVISMAKDLPDWVRPDWLDNFIGAVDRADSSVQGIGKQMQDWGKGTLTNFGKSADEFDKWLDESMKPKEAGAKLAQQIASGLETVTPTKLSGAMIQGSKEAYSLIVKNQARGMGRTEEPLNKLVKGQQKGNDINKAAEKKLGKIEDILSSLGTF